MKKFIFLSIILVSGFGSFAQSLDDINDMLAKFQYQKAKIGIDKFMSDARNAGSTEGLYFKGRVYNSYSKDSSLSIDDAIKAKTESFNAFKRLQEIDKKDLRLKLEFYISYFDLYNGFFDLGAKAYNKQHYEMAYNGFMNALMVEDYVRPRGYEANGFKFPALDTSLVLNTAICARKANQMNEAIKYYKLLEAANLGGPNYIEIYTFLAQYYYDKKSQPEFDALIAKARGIYPNEPYWESSFYEGIVIDNELKGLKGEDLLKKYEELVGRYPTNFILVNNYGIELYKYVYSQEIKPDQVTGYKKKLEIAVKQAISMKSTCDNNFLMANYLYNNSFDLNDLAKNIKGVKPDDVKKRSELTGAAKKSQDECIPYAINAVDLFEKLPKLKGNEKANYKQSLEMLSELYRVKGDAKKSAEYKAKKEAAEK